MKIKLPRVKKIAAPHLAFGEGNRAFRDPQTMVQPDQAFTAAMALPQKTPPLPVVSEG